MRLVSRSLFLVFWLPVGLPVEVQADQEAVLDRAAFELRLARMSAQTPYCTTASLSAGEMILPATWSLTLSEPGCDPEPFVIQHDPRRNWSPVVLPREVIPVLVEKGLIPDPRKGSNVEKLAWLSEVDWWLANEFYWPTEEGVDDRVLILDRLLGADGAWLNGQPLRLTSAELTETRAALGDLLSATVRNRLVLRIKPKTGHRINPAGSGPPLYRFGLGGSAKIARAGDVSIESVASRVLLAADHTRATVELEIWVRKRSPGTIRVHSYARLRLPDKPDRLPLYHSWGRPESLRQGQNRLRLILEEENPRLWWPLGIGEGHVYPVRVMIRQGPTAILAERQILVGFRVIEWDQEGSLIVNGRKVPIKATEWSPVDPFHPEPKRTLSEAFSALIQANLNAVWVRGAHGFETEDFYRLCDQLGILVLQEIPDDPSRLDGHRVRSLETHPSLVAWTRMDEGEGAAAGETASKAGNGAKTLSPSRLESFTERSVRRSSSSGRTTEDWVAPASSRWTGRDACPTHPRSAEQCPSSPPRKFRVRPRRPGDIESGLRIMSLSTPPEPSAISARANSDPMLSLEHTRPVRCVSLGAEAGSLRLVRAPGPPGRETWEEFLEADERWPVPAWWRWDEAAADRLAAQLPTWGTVANYIDYIDLTQSIQARNLQAAIEETRIKRPGSAALIAGQLKAVWPGLSPALIDPLGRRAKGYWAVRRSWDKSVLMLRRAGERFEAWIVNTGTKPISGSLTILDALQPSEDRRTVASVVVEPGTAAMVWCSTKESWAEYAFREGDLQVLGAFVGEAQTTLQLARQLMPILRRADGTPVPGFGRRPSRDLRLPPPLQSSLLCVAPSQIRFPTARLHIIMFGEDRGPWRVTVRSFGRAFLRQVRLRFNPPGAAMADDQYFDVVPGSGRLVTITPLESGRELIYVTVSAENADPVSFFLSTKD